MKNQRKASISLVCLFLVLALPLSSARADDIASKIKSTDEAIQWLQKKKSQDPAGTQAAMDKCKQKLPEVGDISLLLNCMYNMLGD